MTYKYRCAITGNKKTIYSNAVSIIVKYHPEIVVQPVDVNFTKLGETVTFTLKANHADEYIWQCYDPAISDWRNLINSGVWTGYDTDTLSFITNAQRCEYKYRCIVKGEGEKVISNEAQLIQNIVPEPPVEEEDSANDPVVTKQPENITAPSGTEIAFHVEANNAESYRWQRRSTTSSTATWGNVSSTWTGYNTDTLIFTTQSTSYNYEYRCAITGNGKTIYSDAASLTKE